MALLLCYLLAYVGLRIGGVLVLLAILTGLTLIGPQSSPLGSFPSVASCKTD
jgi:hypothetical protein